MKLRPASVAATGVLLLAMSTASHGQGNSTRFVPNDQLFFGHVPSCDTATWEDPCRVPLANGDFSGSPGDDYSHQRFEWIGTGRRHAVAAHIVPWIYLADGDTGWTKRDATHVFALQKPGDVVLQSIRLPPVLDRQRKRAAVPVEYAVRARFGGVPSGAVVSVVLSARRGGAALAEVVATETSRSSTVLPGGRVEASIPFSPEWADAELGIAISYEEGNAPVQIDDVVVLRHTGDGLGELPVD